MSLESILTYNTGDCDDSAKTGYIDVTIGRFSAKADVCSPEMYPGASLDSDVDSVIGSFSFKYISSQQFE